MATITSGSRIHIKSINIDSDAFALQDFEEGANETINIRLINEEGYDAERDATTCNPSECEITVKERYE